MRSMFVYCLTLLSLVSVSGSAYAATLVAGDLTALSSGGVWSQYSNKGYLFNDIRNTTGFDKMTVESFSTLADILVGANRPTHIAMSWMGTANRNTGPLTAGDFALYNGNTLLLSATLGNNDGRLSYTPVIGFGANFDFLSDLTVTGGSLFTAGLVTGIVNVALNGNNGYFAKPKDFLFQDISFTVGYTPGVTPPRNDIPEPATSVLLVSSLAGIVARRRKSRNILA